MKLLLLIITCLSIRSYSYDYNTVIDSLYSILMRDSCEVMFQAVSNKEEFFEGKCNGIQKSLFKDLQSFQKEVDIKFLYRNNWNQKLNSFGGHGSQYDHLWIYYFNTDSLLIFQGIKQCL